MNRLFHLNIEKIFKNKLLIRITTLSLFYIAVLIVLTVSSSPHRYSLEARDIADQDIFAPWDLVDKAATEQKIQESQNNIQPVYKLDLTVQIQIEKKIDYFFNVLNAIRRNYSKEPKQKIGMLKQQADIGLDDDSYITLIKSSDDELKQLISNIKYINNQILNERFSEEQLSAKKNQIKEFFSELQTKREGMNQIGTSISVLLIKPNMFYDDQVTKAKISEAKARVEDVVIRKGTKIINKGEEVNRQHVQLLKAYGLLREFNKFDFRIFFAFTIIIFTCLLIFVLYLNTFSRNIWESSNKIILMSLIACLILIIAVGTRTLSGYLMPLPASAMLISMLVDPRVAILSNIIVVMFGSFIVSFDSTVIITMLLSGMTGAILVNKTHHRSSVMFAGLGISVINALVILSFGLFNNLPIKELLQQGIYGIIGGLFSAVLTIGILPFLESTFDLITPIKLLELSNPNRPILRRILIEAPGTYYHSILVGNLAEAAAEDVGANALLCRVGAYYHDIGKLKRPYFFKENQITKDNPHDRITPSLSATIITSHIKDGVEIAKKNKLPSRIIDIIKEHHGNTLVAYFYHKALSGEDGEQVIEGKFRYQNPRPQSKESAIVMLADSVEAYIRSLSEPTKDQVEKGVKKIISDKLSDAQLDECDLTLRDLDIIAKSFVKVLAGIFHERIEYPEDIKDI